MIDVDNLVKWYGPTLAVDRVTFSIPEGAVVGFLGPNGAGKSTTLRMLTGYLPPSAGRATIAGQNVLTAPEAARARLGYLPESNPLYPEMRVEEFLHFRGKLYGMDRARRKERIGYVCDRCGLVPVRRRLIAALSKGNKQRVGVAQALLHDPPVLILDEPTSGLDPNQIQQFRTLVADLKGKHTVLLSTHILPEVEKTADRVMIIAGGRIVAQGTPAELLRRVESSSRVLVDVKADPQAVKKVFAAAADVSSVDVTAIDGWCRAMVTPRDQKDVRETLGKLISTNAWPLRELRHEVASLEQFFVQITASQT
ncbi:MAG: ABC transporter ATP-binding protein [Phycisphaeraceae bacterium]